MNPTVSLTSVIVRTTISRCRNRWMATFPLRPLRATTLLRTAWKRSPVRPMWQIVREPAMTRSGDAATRLGPTP